MALYDVIWNVTVFKGPAGTTPQLHAPAQTVYMH